MYGFISKRFYIFNNEIAHHIIMTCVNIGVFAFVTWFGLKISDILINKLLKSLEKRDKNSILLRFIPLLRKLTKVLIVFLLLIFTLQMYGFSVSTLVAGIGVGGVVFGLAAQKTIVNMFGSVSLIVDNAYKVGDYICLNISIKDGDAEGYVEDITLRSTKIRCLDGTLLNIPNGVISDSVVKNYSLMKKRIFKTTINLTYSATNEQIEQAKNICLDILKNCDKVTGSPIVKITELNSHSVDLYVLADIKPVSLVQYYSIKDSILCEIYKQFNENNIEFAFPTQTIELKK